MNTLLHKSKNLLKKASLATALLLGGGVAWAQEAEEAAAAATQQAQLSQQEWMLLMLIGTTVFVTILVLITVLYTLVVLRQVVFKEMKGKEAPSLWVSIDKQLTNAIPLEKEESIMLDHNYDGIRELDNHLPPWWVYLFYGTVVFGIIYMFNYHVLEISPLSDEEYEIAMEKASFEVAEYKKLMADNIDENNVEFLSDDSEALAAGKEIYDKNCVACHGAQGEGGTGPNLTDEYWLHGGDIKHIFSTIKYGVAQKGMISWEKKLKPGDMQNVASYILSLQGTNPPNAKEPQGDQYVPEEEEEASK